MATILLSTGSALRVRGNYDDVADKLIDEGSIEVHVIEVDGKQTDTRAYVFHTHVAAVMQ